MSSSASFPKFEVVVIYKTTDRYLIECVEHCLRLDYPDFGLLLLPDEETTFVIEDPRIKVFPTAPDATSIPTKRNVAIEHLDDDTEFVAFIDADAYPSPGWLRAAVPHLAEPALGALGGPDLTPPGDDFRRQVAGLAIRQWLTFGPTSKMFRETTDTQEVTDVRGCNHIMHRDVFEATRYDPAYAACDDAKLSMDLVAQGRRLLFVREMIVYHHRREAFLPLMRQSFYYGRFKTQMWGAGLLPSPVVLAPAALVIGLILTLPAMFAGRRARSSTLGSWIAYVLAVAVSTATSDRRPRYWAHTMTAVAAVHLGYGAGLLSSMRAVLRNQSILVDVPTNTAPTD